MFGPNANSAFDPRSGVMSQRGPKRSQNRKKSHRGSVCGDDKFVFGVVSSHATSVIAFNSFRKRG